MKQINVKQAEKWLDKLKNEKPQSYKEITRFLKRYQRHGNQYECYMKINHTLLQHCTLTREINTYLDQGNKFVVNRPEDEKIKDLIEYVSKNKPQTFKKMQEMIEKMKKRQQSTSMQQLNLNVKNLLRSVVKGDEQLQRIADQALDTTGEQLINRLDLDHLKINQTIIEDTQNHSNIIKNTLKIQNQQQKELKIQKDQYNNIKQQQKQIKQLPFNTPMTITQEKLVFKHLEKILQPKIYQEILKIIKIYYLNIISRNQANEFLNKIGYEEIQYLKDILETRESDRRKISAFRPLNDLDFSTYQRASPSYVTTPFSYPIACINRSDQLKEILNQKWVSVPHGSQQNFNVRNKNPYEINMLKCQDQRYQFDLYMKRLLKTQQELIQILQQMNQKSEIQLNYILDKIIGMGIIQLIYKNSNKEQKQEIQWNLKTNTIEMCKIFKQKIMNQINQLKNIKQTYTNKVWTQIALKNFNKSLDLKGFQFKKNEKDKLKTSVFINQLNDKIKILNNGGQLKSHIMSFQDKKAFFTILNSFQSSSRTQKCFSRKLPQIMNWDLKNQKQRHLYPVIILAFENQKICSLVYTLILFYIDSSTLNENQKIRCKLFLEQFLINYLGWFHPQKHYLSDNFDEQQFLHKLSKNNQHYDDKIYSWINCQKQELFTMINQEQQQLLPKFKVQINQNYIGGYEPKKKTNRSIFYCSQLLYSFLRFLYAVYQRMIKMQEVIQINQKMIMFEILFYTCIKAKQGVKFQDNLNNLFNKSTYLFSTIYKLFENLLKSLNNVSLCPITTQSFKYIYLQSQQIYLLTMNKFCLINNCFNSKLIRLNYQQSSKVIYLNYFESYFKNQDPTKDVIKRRMDISRQIQHYTVSNSQFGQRKKRKHNEVLQNNEMQYIFESSTIKMTNYQEKQDSLIYIGKKIPLSRAIKRDLKRSYKFINRIK